jgi:hypothetical protein
MKPNIANAHIRLFGDTPMRILLRVTTARPTWLTDNYPSYDEIVDSFPGLTVDASQTFGSYQGDIGYILCGPIGLWGYLLVGYGSCSGCDHLQAITGDVGADYSTGEGNWQVIVDFRDELIGQITWKESAEALARHLVFKVDSNDGSDWYWHDSEISRWFRSWAEDRLSPEYREAKAVIERSQGALG